MHKHLTSLLFILYRPGEFAAHWVSAAQGVASIATVAAHSAYNTARDVFRTLQARDKVVIQCLWFTRQMMTFA